MDLAELKLVSAANLIHLRTDAGMTQAELGAKLNYSDKSISKWERAEAIPDAFVLTQIAAIFGVTVDYLLTSHDKWEPSVKEKETVVYSLNTIIAIAILGVFTLTLTVFITLWMLDIIEWRVFLIGLNVAVIVFMVMDCVMKKARYIRYTVCTLIVSLFLLAFSYLQRWQILILLVPALVIANLACSIKRKPRKKQKTESMELAEDVKNTDN